MRYRRFGQSDLEVSEVGFGVWTLASDGSDLPLTPDEAAHLTGLWHDNFGVTNRYEMPLKSSIGG